MRSDIVFDPKKHTYTKGNKKYTSVTTIASNLFDRFNSKEVARKLAKFPKNKIEKKGVRYWLNTWKESAAHGTRVHDMIHNYILDHKFKPLGKTDSDNLKFRQAVLFLNNNGNIKLADHIYSEMIVGYDKYLVAGTIDLCVSFDKGYFYIYDWKTNDKISKEGYKGKKGILEVSKDMEDSKLMLYTIQLNLYAYILEHTLGHKVAGLYLIHLSDYFYTEIPVVIFSNDIIEKILESEANVEYCKRAVGRRKTKDIKQIIQEL